MVMASGDWRIIAQDSPAAAMNELQLFFEGHLLENEVGPFIRR